MKIGVRTIVLNENYGGILQAYALQRILREMGHDATLIDRRRGFHMPFGAKCKSYTKRFLMRYILNKNIPVRIDAKIENDIKIMSTYTRPFIDKYIKRIITSDFSNISERDFDAYIVGSDQIWRAPASRPQLYNVFLEFTQGWNVKRLSYAASFSTEEWEYNNEETEHCGKLLRKFDKVSVREISGVNLCKKKFDKEATFVLDPTMLIEKEEYSKLFEDANTAQSNGELFCYILDKSNEKERLINNVAKIKGYKPFFVNSKYQDETAPIEERIQPPVEEWLRGFHDAKFVITDSFHACVFSIIYNKPFIVYKNEGRGNARFDSLLRTFGLEERSFSDINALENIANKEINWEEVNKKLKSLKEQSLNYLKEALNA